MRAKALLLIAMLGGCGHSPIEQAQEIARHDLNDPAAAQFRDVAEIEGGSCVAGQMNAKNKLGAYTGFRPFIVDLRSRAVGFAPDGAESDTDYARALRMDIMSKQCAEKS